MKKTLFEAVGDEQELTKLLEAGEERNVATLAVSIFATGCQKSVKLS